MRKKRENYGTLRRVDHRLDLSPAGRSLFVTREKELQQRQAQRIRGWMRLVLTLALAAAGVAGAVVAVAYLAPWFRSEITVSSASEADPSSLAEEIAPDPPVYDEMGLVVYDQSVCLFTVNTVTPAGADLVPELAEFGGVQVDAKIVPALRMLVSAAKEDGLALVLTEGYVSYQEQEERFNQLTRELEKTKGLSAVMARAEAAALIPQPGQSDFQSGLCVRLDGDPETFSQSKTYSWLKANMGKYGFIFRYPQYKEEYTGVSFDPTVIRWVGGASASAMTQRSMCLEEYIAYLNSQ